MTPSHTPSESMDMTLEIMKAYNEQLLRNSTKNMFDTLVSLFTISTNTDLSISSSNSTLVLVGILFAVLFLSGCCILAFCCYKRRYVQCHVCKTKMTKKELERHIHECSLHKVVPGDMDDHHSKVCPYKDV
jgi:hypothetical protein